MYLLFMLSSHANAHITALCLWWLCLMWLLNFSQSDIWWPMSLVKRFWIVYATCIYGSVSYVMTLWSLPHPPQATQEVVSRVPCATQSEMNAAVEAATRAYPAWSLYWSQLQFEEVWSSTGSNILKVALVPAKSFVGLCHVHIRIDTRLSPLFPTANQQMAKNIQNGKAKFQALYNKLWVQCLVCITVAQC